MTESRLTSRAWFILVATLGSGIVAALVTVYGTQVFRTSTYFHIGITSVTVRSPQPNQVFLSPTNLIDLDAATTETIPEFRKLRASANEEFIEAITGFDTADIFSQPAVTQAISAHEEKSVPVSVALLDSVFEAVARAPSSRLTTATFSNHANTIRGMSIDTAEIFSEALEDYLTSDAVLRTAFDLFNSSELVELEEMVNDSSLYF